jgi:hypothetical protein
MRKYLVRVIATLSVVAIALTFAGVVRAAEGATAQTKPAKPVTHDATGTITAVSATAGTLSIKKHDATVETFTIASDCKVSTADKKDATVADLKVDDKVTVVYTGEAGAMVAQKIGPAKAHVPRTKGAAK